MNTFLIALLFAGIVASVMGAPRVDREVGMITPVGQVAQQVIVSTNALLSETVNHVGADDPITTGDYTSEFGSIWRYEDNLNSYSFKNTHTSKYLCANETGHMKPQGTKDAACMMLAQRQFALGQRGYYLVLGRGSASSAYYVMSPFLDTTPILCGRSCTFNDAKKKVSDANSSKHQFYLHVFL